MTNLRRVGLVLVAALVVFLFAAPTRDTKGIALRKFPNRVPVRFWHMWSAEWKDVVDEIVDRYNQSQTEYEVIPLSIPNGADTKFLLGTIGGDPPDVMAQWNAVIPTWAEGGMLTPFDEVMSPPEKAQFEREAYPVVKRIGQYKGKTYGIPIGINAYAVFYLPQALRDEGLREFPKTWEEINAASARLTTRDASGNLKRVGFLPGSWMNLMPLFGGGLYDFGANRLTLDRRENFECLDAIVALRKRDGYDAVQRFQSGLNTQSFAGGWPFIGGAYASVIDGQWRVEQLAKYAPKLEYATAPLPAPKGGTPGACVAGGNFMLIPRSGRQKAGAWDFVKFWSGLENPERAAEFYVKGGWLPLSERIASAPIYQNYLRKHPQFGTFVDAVRNPDLQAQPPVAYQVFVADTVGKLEDLALRGTISPSTAVGRLKDKVRREVARRKELGYDD